MENFIKKLHLNSLKALNKNLTAMKYFLTCLLNENKKICSDNKTKKCYNHCYKLKEEKWNYLFKA